MSLTKLYETLRKYGKRIGAEASEGSEKAQKVIDCYKLHYACPEEHESQALVMAAFEEWAKDKVGGF